MSRLGRVATLLVAFALLAPAVPAGAHDHKRPRVTLRSHGERQRGLPWSSQWVRGDGNSCVAEAVDGIPNYRRKAMLWNPENPLHLYLYKRQKPDKVRVLMHRRWTTMTSRQAALGAPRSASDARPWTADGAFGSRTSQLPIGDGGI